MDESLITNALAEQWPLVTVILLTFFRGARSALWYVRDLERKFDLALKAQTEHATRMERAFEEIVQVLRQGVADIRDRTSRHSRVLEELGAEVSVARGRIDLLERSGTTTRTSTGPLRPVS